MPPAPRPAQVKIDIVKPPSTLRFAESQRLQTSLYRTKLQEALKAESCIRILHNDKYLIQQFRAAAKKLKIKIVFASEGTFLFIKPLEISEEIHKLMLYLREPRTEFELQSKKLELHLPNTLSDLKSKGLIHFNKDKWSLTEKGFDTL